VDKHLPGVLLDKNLMLQYIKQYQLPAKSDKGGQGGQGGN